MRLKSVLLISLFSTNIGEWVYFIALNLMVLRLTDSALSVSILYVLLPIAMLLTNSWAGSVVDRVNIRKLLIGLNLLRAIFVATIAFTTNLFVIYSFSLLLQMLTAIYATASFVYITKVIDEKEQQRFNGWKSMAQSSGFILGPSIAGTLFIVGSVETAILVNAVILVVSSILHMYLPNTNAVSSNPNKATIQMIREDWLAVFHYTKTHRTIALIFILNGFYMICLTAIDSLEVAFATTVLLLDESAYGLLVSMAGIGFIIGSTINIKWLLPPLTAMRWGMIGTVVGYLIYSISHSWGVAAVGFFIVSGAQTFVNVGFTTYLQKNLANELLGRFISVCSLIEALGMIIMISAFGILTEFIVLRNLVKSGVVILLIVGVMFLILELLMKRRKFKAVASK